MPNQQTGKTKKFQVVIPDGVVPGNSFSLLAAGVRVIVTCPNNARPGQKLQFELPEGLVNRPEGPKCLVLANSEANERHQDH